LNGVLVIVVVVVVVVVQDIVVKIKVDTQPDSCMFVS
jgi:hypothetical protein